MPIFYKNREIKNLTIGDQIVNAVYYGTYLIWEAISCCFGKGYWINTEVWDNEVGWKN